MSRNVPQNWSKHPEIFPYKIETKRDAAQCCDIDLLYSLHSFSENPIEFTMNGYLVGTFVKEYHFPKPLNVRGANYTDFKTSELVLMKGEAVFDKSTLMNLDETYEIMGKTFRTCRGVTAVIS